MNEEENTKNFALELEFYPKGEKKEEEEEEKQMKIMHILRNFIISSFTKIKFKQ